MTQRAQDTTFFLVSDTLTRGNLQQSLPRNELIGY